MWSPMATAASGFGSYGESDGMASGAGATARTSGAEDVQTTPASLLSSDRELTVTPGAAHFNDVQPGQTYQLTISIRNTSSKTKRIRVLPPSATRSFAIHYDTNAASSLAPGMSLPCTVMFACPPGGEYVVPRDENGVEAKAIAVDSLMIRSDTATVSVPARAFPPAPRLTVDTPVIDFGPLLAGTSAAKVIRVTNHSTLMGGEAVFLPSSKAEGLIMAAPDRVALAAATPDAIAGQRNTGLFKIELNTQGADEGVLDLQATISVPGSSCTPIAISIKARISEHIISVLDADNGDLIKLETPVELGTTFYGAEVRQQIVVFNDGPVPVTFSISTKDGLPEFQATANADDGLSVTSRGSVVTAAASAHKKRDATMFNASSVNAALNRITALSNPPLATPKASRPGTAAAIHTTMAAANAAANTVGVPGAPGMAIAKPPLQGGNAGPGGAPEPMGIGIAGSGCQHLRVSPREGTLKPYEKKVLTIHFRPKDTHTPSGFKAQVELATDRQRSATKKLVSLLGPAGAPLPLASPFSGTKLPGGFTGEALSSLTAGRDVFVGAAQALALGTVDPNFRGGNDTSRSDASRDPHAPATLPMPPNPYARPLGNYYHTDSRIRLADAEAQGMQGASGAAGMFNQTTGSVVAGSAGITGGGSGSVIPTGKGPLATLLNSPAHLNANKKALAAKGIIPGGSLNNSGGLGSPERGGDASPDRRGGARPQSASSGGKNTLDGSGDGQSGNGQIPVSKNGPPLLSALNPADIADREASRLNAVARAQTIATVSPFQVASETAVPPPPAETVAATVTLHVPQLELDLPIIVYGIAERTIVEASTSTIEFGDTAISGRSDAVVSLTSFTRSLPVRVRVGKMANVTSDPPSVLLPAGETRTLHLTYQPTRLAPLNDTLPVSISLVSAAALEAIRELQKQREQDEMEAKGIVPYHRQRGALSRTGRSRSPEKGPNTGEPTGKFAATAAAESAKMNASEGNSGDGGPGRGRDKSSSAIAAQRALATGQLARPSAGATILRSKVTKEMRVHDPQQAMQIMVEEAHAEAEQKTKMAIAEAKARGDTQGAVVAAQALSQEVLMFALPVRVTGKPVVVAPTQLGVGQSAALPGSAMATMGGGAALLGNGGATGALGASGIGAANRLMDRTLANSPIASPPPEPAANNGQHEHGGGGFSASSPSFTRSGATATGRFSPGPDPSVADVAEAAARLSQLGMTGGGDDGVVPFDAADGEQRQHLKKQLQALGSPTRDASAANNNSNSSSKRPNSGSSMSGKVKLPPASPLRVGVAGIGSGGGMASLLRQESGFGVSVPSLLPPSKGPDFAPASTLSQAFAGAVSPLVYTPGLSGVSQAEQLAAAAAGATIGAEGSAISLIKVGPDGEAVALASTTSAPIIMTSSGPLKPHKETPITAFGSTLNKIVAPSGVPAAGVAASLFATAAVNTKTAVNASGQVGTSTLQADKMATSGAHTFSQRFGAAASAAEGNNPASLAAASAINAAGLDVSVGAIISIANAAHNKAMKEAGIRAAAAVAGAGGLRGTQGVALLAPGSGFGPSAVSGNSEPTPPSVNQLFSRSGQLRARQANDPLEALLPEMKWADQSGQLKDRLQNGASLPPSAMKQSVPAAQLANTVQPLSSSSGAMVAFKRGPGLDPAAAAAALSKLPASLLAAAASQQGGIFRTAPAVKLPFWGMIAARKGLGEHDVSSSPVYTYTLGQLHARQMHREAYIAFLRSAAGNKKPMPPHGAAGSHVSAGSRQLLARIGRLTQRGIIPTLEDEDTGAEYGSTKKNGKDAPPRWDPEEAINNPTSSLGLRDGKKDLAEPKLVLPFDPSTIMSTEPLWLLRPIPGRGGAGLGSTAGGGASGPTSKYRHNPDKLIKKKHKPQPTTKGENIDCSQTLTDDQQAMISAGPTVLQFGVFNVRTEVKKNFTVVNDLAQSILVELNIDEEETPQLIRSSPTSQVIPAGGIAGFDITFYTEDSVDLRELVRYTINKQHTGQFLVTATALPIVVTLSKRDCNLRFAEGSLDRMSSDVVTLTNPGSSAAEYKWTPIIPQSSAITASASAVALLTRASSRPGTAAALAAQREAKEAAALAKRTGQAVADPNEKKKKKDEVPPPSKAAHVAAQVAAAAAAGINTAAANPLDSFNVEPMEGVIPPGGSVQARFTYTPLAGALTSVRYQLQVLGGLPGDNGTVLLHGDEQSTSIVSKEATLDFGNMGVGLTREMTVTLINDSNNTGQNAAGVWYVATELLPPGVTVEPLMGRLVPGENVEIGVSIFSKVALKLNGETNKEHGITFHTRGGPSFVVPVSANVIVPDVRLIDALGSLVLDFGGVLIGAMNRKRVAIANKSPISTEICVDLSAFPDWYIAPPTLFAGIENDGTSIGDDSLIQAESVGGFSLTSDRFSTLQKNETAAALSIMNNAANTTLGSPLGSPNGNKAGTPGRGGLAASSRKSVVGGGSSVSPPPSAGTSISRAGRRRTGARGNGINEDALSAAGDDEDEDDDDDEKENGGTSGEGGSADGPNAGIPQPDGTVALPNQSAADADDLGMLGALVGAPAGPKKKADSNSVVARDANGNPLSDIDPVPDDPRLVSLPRTFKVKLQPDGTLPFDLIFRPTSRKEYDFCLPVTLTGCGSVPELARPVVGYGVKPKMRAEPGTTIDFELKVVSPDPTRRVPYSQTFAIRNTDDEGKEVRWRADTSNLKPSFGGMQQVFFFEPSSGVIPPGELQLIKVRFAPDAVRTYINTIPIFLIDEDGNDVGSVIPSPRPQTPAGSSVFSGYTAAREALLSRGTITDGSSTNGGAGMTVRTTNREERSDSKDSNDNNDENFGRQAREPPPAPPQPVRSGQLSPRVSRPPSPSGSRGGKSRPSSGRLLNAASTAAITAEMKEAQSSSSASGNADGAQPIGGSSGTTGSDLVSAAEQAIRIEQAQAAAKRLEDAAKATNEVKSNQNNQTEKQRELAVNAAALVSVSTGRPSTSNTMVSGRTAFSAAGYGGGAATAGGYLQPYIELELKGAGMLPCLSFDTRDVVLPPVPLGAESRATFYICAHGYDHLTLQHKFTVGSYAAAAGMAGGPGPFAGSVRDRGGDGRSTAFVGPGPGTLANFVQGPPEGGAAVGMTSPSRGATAAMLTRGASSTSMMSPGGPPGSAGGFSVGAPATRGGFGTGGLGALSPVREDPRSPQPGSADGGLASPGGFRAGGGSALSSSSSGVGGPRPNTTQTVASINLGAGGGGYGSASASGSVYGGGDAERPGGVTFQGGRGGSSNAGGGSGALGATSTAGGVVGGAGAQSGAGSEAVQQAVEKELMSIPVAVVYPCGNILSMSRPRIPITVCFKSAVPMAFTILLEFKDPEGRPFTIPVSGCADSSVLTSYPYLEANCRRLAYSTLLAPPPILPLMDSNHSSNGSLATTSKDQSVPGTAAHPARNNGGGGTLGVGAAAPGEAALNAAIIPPAVKLIGLPPSKSGGVDAPSPVKTALQISAAAASAAIAATAGIRKGPPLAASADDGRGSFTSANNNGNGSDNEEELDTNKSGSKALALPAIEAIPPPMSLPHLRNLLRRVYAKALAPQPTLAGTLGSLGLTSARADPAQIEAQKKALAQQLAEKKAQQLAVNIALTYGTQASLSLPPPQPVWPIRGPSVPVLSSTQAGVLMRWLNAVLFRSPISKFPEDLATQHAKPVIDAIEAYSGATVPGKFKGRIPANKRERAVVMFNQARDLLTFLRGQGAMLPHIRPETLLLKEDFARVRKYQHKGAFGAPWGAPVLQYLSPSERIRRRKFLSAAWPQLSLEAWTAVCLQVVRLYMLPRVSMGAVLTVAGVILGLEGEEYLRYVSLRESALGAAAKVLDDKNGAAAGSGGNDADGVDRGGSSGNASQEPGREKGKSASQRLALEAALNAIAAASASAVAEGCAIPLSEAAASGKLNAAAMRRSSLAGSEDSQAQVSATINPQGSSASANGSGIFEDGSAYGGNENGNGGGNNATTGSRRGGGGSASSASSSNLFGATASSSAGVNNNATSNNLVLRLRAASKPFQQLAYAIFTNAGSKGTGFPVGNLFQGLGIGPTSEDTDSKSGKNSKDGPMSPKAKAAAIAAAARKSAMSLSASSNAFAVNAPGFDPNSSSSSSASGSSSIDEDSLVLEEDEEIAAREGLDIIARAAGSRIPLDLSQVLAERSSVARLLSRLVGPDHGLASSNIYSTSEGLLLRWLTYHRNRGCAAAALPFLNVGGDSEKKEGSGNSSGSGSTSRPGTGNRSSSAGGQRAGSRLASRSGTGSGKRGKSSSGGRPGTKNGDAAVEEKPTNPAWRVDFIPRRIVSFDADLRDLSAFVFALVSHCPELAQQGRVLDFSSGAVHAYPRTHAQRRENALAIMRALQELELGAPFNADDLCPAEDLGAPLPPNALRIANNAANEDGSITSRPGSPGNNNENQLLEGQVAAEDSLSMLGNNSKNGGRGGTGSAHNSVADNNSGGGGGGVAASMTELGHVPSTGLLLAACQIAGEPMAMSDEYVPPPPNKGAGGVGLSQPLFSSPAAVGTSPQYPDGLTKLPVPALTHQDVFLPPPPLPEDTKRPSSAGSTASGMGRTAAGALTTTTTNSNANNRTSNALASTSQSQKAAEKDKLHKGPVVLPVTTLNSPVSARNGLLWCLWLYQTLPGLVPRHLIDFEGASGDRIIRSVTLTNPTIRPITYQIVLEGSKEFSLLSASQIRIEPNGSSVVTIACCPRFARPVHAKLSCRSKRDGALMPQMLAFTLRSRVVKRPPVAQKEATARTYASAVVDVEVRNNFNSDGLFRIVVIALPSDSLPGNNLTIDAIKKLRSESPSPFVVPPSAAIAALQSPISLNSLPMLACPPPPINKAEYAIIPPHKKVAMQLLGRMPKSSGPAVIHTGIASNGPGVFPGDSGSIASLDAASSFAGSAAGGRSAGGYVGSSRPGEVAAGLAAMPPPPPHTFASFWCKYPQVFLRAGQAKKIPIQFAPLQAGAHRAALVLTDVNYSVGEMVIELTGRATAPVPFSKLYDRVTMPALFNPNANAKDTAAALAAGGGAGSGSGSSDKDLASATSMSLAKTGGLRVTFEEPGKTLASAAIAALGNGHTTNAAANHSASTKGLGSAAAGFLAAQQSQMNGNSASDEGLGGGGGGGSSKAVPVLNVVRLLSIPPLNPQLESAKDALIDRLERSQRSLIQKGQDMQRVADAQDRLKAMTLLRTFGIAGTRPGRVKGGSVYATASAASAAGVPSGQDTANGKVKGVGERPSTAAVGVLNATAAVIANAGRPPLAPGGSIVGAGSVGGGGGGAGSAFAPAGSAGMGAGSAGGGAGSARDRGMASGASTVGGNNAAGSTGAGAGGDSWLQSAMNAIQGTGGGVVSNAAEKPPGIPQDVAEELINAIGKFYSVHVDSPFFEAPAVIFVPGPLFPLTGAQVVAAAAAAVSNNQPNKGGVQDEAMLARLAQTNPAAAAMMARKAANAKEGTALLSALQASSSNFGSSVSHPVTPAIGSRAYVQAMTHGVGSPGNLARDIQSAVNAANTVNANAAGAAASSSGAAGGGRAPPPSADGGLLTANGRLNILPLVPPASGSAGASLVQQLTANLAAAVISNPQQAVSLAAQAMTSGALQSLIAPHVGPVPPTATPRTPQALAAQLAANVLGAPTPKATTEMATELANQLPELYSPEAVAEAFARGEQASMEMLAKLPVTLKARHAGVYSTRITLINDAGKLFAKEGDKAGDDSIGVGTGSSKPGDDVRVYDIEIALEASSPTPSLTYTTAAHKPVTQLVPITNTTDNDWVLEACFQATAHMAPGRYGPVSNLLSAKDPSSPLRSPKAGGTIISPQSGVGPTGMLTAGGWSSPGAAASRLNSSTAGGGGGGAANAGVGGHHSGGPNNNSTFTHHFSCPLRLHVPPYQSVNLPVTFAPTEVCEDSALLVLRHNPAEEAAVGSNRVAAGMAAAAGSDGKADGNSSGGLVTAGYGRQEYSHSRPNTSTNLLATSPPPSRLGLLSAPGTSAGGERPTFDGGSGGGMPGPSEASNSISDLKFDLHGIATEPLASDFLYANCAARDSVTLTVPVLNHDATGSAGIIVDCNLPSHLGFEGVKQVSVPAATLISDPRSNIGAPPMVIRPPGKDKKDNNGGNAGGLGTPAGKRGGFGFASNNHHADDEDDEVDSRAGDHESGPPSPMDNSPPHTRPGSPGADERFARGETTSLAKKKSKKQLNEGGFDEDAPMAGQAVIPGEVSYSFTLRPSVSGNFAGSISFRHPRTRALHWYGVEVTVTEANPVASIQLVTVARGATTATLEISNPTAEAATFEVACIGEGVLGDSVIVVPGNGSRIFEVIYAPLLPTTDEPAPSSVLANPSLLSQGATAAVNNLINEGGVVPSRGAVRFTSAGVAGEYTYSLDLVAFPSPPIQVPPVSCPLGERVRIPFTIENPTPNPAVIYGAVDDMQHFCIDFEDATSGPVIETLPSSGSSTAIVPVGAHNNTRKLGDLARAAEVSPMSSRTVFIVFTPSAIGVRQGCTALLTSDTIGEWELSLSGSGLPPRKQDEVAVSTPIGTTATSSFVFRNPFPCPVYVLPRLEINGSVMAAGAVGSAAAAVISATNRSNLENLNARFQSTTGAGMGASGAASASNSLRALVDHAVTSAFGSGEEGAPAVTLLRDKPIRVPAYGSVQVPFAFAPTAISEAAGEAQLLVWPERVEDGFALGFSPINPSATPAQYQHLQQQRASEAKETEDGSSDAEHETKAAALADQQDSWYARLPGVEDDDAASRVGAELPPMPFSPLRVPSSGNNNNHANANLRSSSNPSSPAPLRPSAAASRAQQGGNAAPSAASYSVFVPLKWSYPVRCTAEAPVASKVVKITCPARQTVVMPFAMPLPGFEVPPPQAQSYNSGSSSSSGGESADGGSTMMGGGGSAGVSFTMAVVPAASALKNGVKTDTGVKLDAEGVTQMVKQAVKVLPKRNRLYSSHEPVELEVVLQPTKALSTLPVELLITAMRGGGAWRFPLLLSFPPASVDGTIVIESPRGVPGSRVISIRNVVPTAARYRCYLTPDTPGEFRVTPSEGILPPGPKRDTSAKGARAALLSTGGGTDDGAGGGQGGVEWFEGQPPQHLLAEGWVPFTVIFTPREYGRTCAGRMVIETDNFAWTFSLRGRLNTYVPPELRGTVGDAERGGSGSHFAAPSPRRR